MFVLFHIGSVLILSMAGSLFLFISVVAFIASRQKWESILFMTWLCFGSVLAFNALCLLTIGVKNGFAICDQTDSVTYYLWVILLSVLPGRVFVVGFLFVFSFSSILIIKKKSSFFNIQARHSSFYFLKCSFVVIFLFPEEHVCYCGDTCVYTLQ